MNGTEIITLLSNNLPAVSSIVESVTGGVFTAIFLRHDTSTTEFEKVKAGQFKEVADELLNAGKMSYTEYYKANNFLKVAQKADEFYAEMHHEDEHKPYDFDWFVRFYEAVGNISNEEMQDLWAKILAGELNEPFSFSLRTIDVLKNLGKKDAELFEKICSHSIHSGNNNFIPNYHEYLEYCGIQYLDIMKLSEQGLLYNDPFLVLPISTSKKSQIICLNNELGIMQEITDDTVKKFEIKQFPFTTVGSEIAALKKIITSDDDFLFFAKQLNKKKNKDIAVHRIIKREDNQVVYQKENLIEGEKT